MTFMTWLMLASAVWASGEAELAEYKRLSGEMEMLGQRAQWKGVSKHFEKMCQLDVNIKEKDFLLAAQAAQEMGNMRKAVEHLRAAVEINPKQSTQRWLSQIEEGYGNVELRLLTKGEPKLKAHSYPVDPVKRNVITVAQEMLNETDEFIGMLPVGDYTFIDYQFEVQSGVAIQLELSPKQRRNGLIAPLFIKHDND